MLRVKSKLTELFRLLRFVWGHSEAAQAFEGMRCDWLQSRDGSRGVSTNRKVREDVRSLPMKCCNILNSPISWHEKILSSPYIVKVISILIAKIHISLEAHGSSMSSIATMNPKSSLLSHSPKLFDMSDTRQPSRPLPFCRPFKLIDSPRRRLQAPAPAPATV